MLGQVLGQFEPSELVVGRDAPHHAGLLQIHQVTVAELRGMSGRVSAMSLMLTGWPAWMSRSTIARLPRV